MYLLMGSSMFSLPRSWRRRMLAAVNCLVMEPRRNLVVEELGTFHSRSAEPYEGLVAHVGVDDLLHARGGVGLGERTERRQAE
jgi:hypothetical protein